jgi:hypothetical protein
MPVVATVVPWEPFVSAFFAASAARSTVPLAFEDEVPDASLGRCGRFFRSDSICWSRSSRETPCLVATSLRLEPLLRASRRSDGLMSSSLATSAIGSGREVAAAFVVLETLETLETLMGPPRKKLPGCSTIRIGAHAWDLQSLHASHR